MEARRALLWLAFLGRPLGIEEVAEAAVVDLESDPLINPKNQLLDPNGDILEILGSLATVSVNIAKDDQEGHSYDSGPEDRLDDDPYDDTRNIPILEIRLAHFSVKDLVSERILGQKSAIFGTTAIEGNVLIAKSCLKDILHYSERVCG